MPFQKRNKLGRKFEKGHKPFKGMLGKKHSEETKKKLSESHIGRPATVGFSGKHHSEETKEKMRKAMKELWQKPEYRKECPNKRTNWKGGKVKGGNGYILIWQPTHPFIGKGTHKYIMEHRLVMEKYLGRYLTPEEQVHHKNGVRTDNRIENLELVSYPHYGKIICPFCSKEFLIK